MLNRRGQNGIARSTFPLLQRSTASRTDYNSPPRKLSSRTTMNSIFRQSALRRMYLINNARTNTPLPKPHGVSGVRSKQIMSVGIQTENCSAGTAVSKVTIFCQTLSVNTWGTDTCCLQEDFFTIKATRNHLGTYKCLGNPRGIVDLVAE